MLGNAQNQRQEAQGERPNILDVSQVIYQKQEKNDSGEEGMLNIFSLAITQKRFRREKEKKMGIPF